MVFSKLLKATSPSTPFDIRCTHLKRQFLLILGTHSHTCHVDNSERRSLAMFVAINVFGSLQIATRAMPLLMSVIVECSFFAGAFYFNPNKTI